MTSKERLMRAVRSEVKTGLGGKVGMIGGLDQGGILSRSCPAEVRQEVHALFHDFGEGGGYVCSAIDHFFNASVENLKAMAKAARECVY